MHMLWFERTVLMLHTPVSILPVHAILKYHLGDMHIIRATTILCSGFAVTAWARFQLFHAYVSMLRIHYINRQLITPYAILCLTCNTCKMYSIKVKNATWRATFAILYRDCLKSYRFILSLRPRTEFCVLRRIRSRLRPFRRFRRWPHGRGRSIRAAASGISRI